MKPYPTGVISLLGRKERKGVEHSPSTIILNFIEGKKMEEPLKKSILRTKLFCGPSCTCFWVGLESMKAFSHSPYLISFIGRDISKDTILWSCLVGV